MLLRNEYSTGHIGKHRICERVLRATNYRQQPHPSIPMNVLIGSKYEQSTKPDISCLQNPFGFAMKNSKRALL